MLVMNWMSQPAIKIDADDSLEDAVCLIKKHEIHMLPVMQNGHLVGMVTDRDIKEASFSDVLSENRKQDGNPLSGIKVKKIMTHDPVTVPFDYTLEETVRNFWLIMFRGYR